MTWNNFVPPTSNPLFTTSVNTSGMSLGTQVSFALSEELVQSWIDNPETNYGLFIHADSTGDARDLYFVSREYVPPGGEAGDWAPKLTFSASEPAFVPEPISLLLVGIGLFGVAAARLRVA